MTIKERMQAVLTLKKSNPTQLAKTYKVNQKTLNSQINGDTSVSASTLLLIVEAFDVSAEWLLRGEGPMERTAPSLCDESLREENQMLREEIITLHLEIARLRKQTTQKAAG